MELILTLILAATTVPVPGPPPVVVTPSGVELTRLADNTMIPGTVGSFFHIETLFPEACGERVLFTGFDERARMGLYSASPSGVEIIADTTVPVPDSTETFQEAREPRCEGERAFFLGSDSASPNRRRSVFTWAFGAISSLLEVGTPVGGTVIQSVNDLDVNELGIVTVARFPFGSIGTEGVVAQRFGGEPFLIADRTTVLPGQSNPPDIYSRPVAAGRDVVFLARTFVTVGIYRWSETEGLSLIVDTSMRLPATGGQPLSTFEGITSLDEGIVFGARFGREAGVFIERDGVIDLLVAPGDVAAGGEVLQGASIPRGEGSLVAFNGVPDFRLGEMTFVRRHDGTLKRLLSRGETLGGLPVDGIIFDADAESVALRINHGTGSQAVYRASFPPPAPATTEIPTLSEIGFALLASALAFIGLAFLRRAA